MRGRDGAFWHKCTACRWAGYRRFSDAPCPHCKGRVELTANPPGPRPLPWEDCRVHINVYVPRKVAEALTRERKRTRVRTLSRMASSILEAWLADGSLRRESAE